MRFFSEHTIESRDYVKELVTINYAMGVKRVPAFLKGKGESLKCFRCPKPGLKSHISPQRVMTSEIDDLEVEKSESKN